MAILVRVFVIVSFFVVWGVGQWFENAPGTCMIVFTVLISHIVHSKSINFGSKLCPQYSVFLPDGRLYIIVFLLNGDRKLLFSTRKFSPDSLYLHFGEFPRSWDTKNRSSHTQIVHIEIMRAHMHLKSGETEGDSLSEHMHTFAENKLLAPKDR